MGVAYESLLWATYNFVPLAGRVWPPVQVNDLMHRILICEHLLSAPAALRAVFPLVAAWIQAKTWQAEHGLVAVKCALPRLLQYWKQLPVADQSTCVGFFSRAVAHVCYGNCRLFDGETLASAISVLVVQLCARSFEAALFNVSAEDELASRWILLALDSVAFEQHTRDIPGISRVLTDELFLQSLYRFCAPPADWNCRSTLPAVAARVAAAVKLLRTLSADVRLHNVFLYTGVRLIAAACTWFLQRTGVDTESGKHSEDGLGVLETVLPTTMTHSDSVRREFFAMCRMLGVIPPPNMARAIAADNDDAARAIVRYMRPRRALGDVTQHAAQSLTDAQCGPGLNPDTVTAAVQSQFTPAVANVLAPMLSVHPAAASDLLDAWLLQACFQPLPAAGMSLLPLTRMCVLPFHACRCRARTAPHTALHCRRYGSGTRRGSRHCARGRGRHAGLHS